MITTSYDHLVILFSIERIERLLNFSSKHGQLKLVYLIGSLEKILSALQLVTVNVVEIIRTVVKFVKTPSFPFM